MKHVNSELCSHQVGKDFSENEAILEERIFSENEAIPGDFSENQEEKERVLIILFISCL